MHYSMWYKITGDPYLNKLWTITYNHFVNCATHGAHSELCSSFIGIQVKINYVIICNLKYTWTQPWSTLLLFRSWGFVYKHMWVSIGIAILNTITYIIYYVATQLCANMLWSRSQPRKNSLFMEFCNSLWQLHHFGTIM